MMALAPARRFRLTLILLVVVMALIDTSSSLTCYKTITVADKEKTEPLNCDGEGDKPMPNPLCYKVMPKSKPKLVHSGCMESGEANALKLGTDTCKEMTMGEAKKISLDYREKKSMGRKLDVADNEYIRICACNKDKCNDSSFNGNGNGSEGLHPIPGFIFGSAVIIAVWHLLGLGF